MRYITAIFALLAPVIAAAQTNDTRAVLEIKGRINELSVSPAGKIWLTSATGNLYYANSIDSLWHYAQPLLKDSGNWSGRDPHLDRITFFNRDTAIMTGYISADERSYKKNGLYFTGDEGRSWKMIDFGGDSWIYNTFLDKAGHAWMGGSSGDIYYSDDYGQSWKKRHSPYNQSTRMHYIWMTDQENGISGALENYIYTTDNNWNSSDKIPTPFDQKKYTNETGSYSDNRIEKIIPWNNYFVVDQNGHIFYTEKENIDWKPFPVKVLDFELDRDANKLYAVTSRQEVILFSSPTEYQTIAGKTSQLFPLDLKAADHSLYVLSTGYDVYRINSAGIEHCPLYTNDRKIHQPRHIAQGKKITWGISGEQLYLSNNGEDWYREKALDIYVSSLRLLNDSTAVLWTGTNNYLYSLHDHTAIRYNDEHPLADFIASPVSSFKIVAGSQGCFHSVSEEVRYEKENTELVTNDVFENKSRENNSYIFHNTIKSNELANILASIDSAPSHVPSIKEFGITEKDRKDYLDMVDKQLKDKNTEYIGRKKKINKEFYYSVPAMLDTISTATIANVLNEPEGVISTTSNWFTIQFVNDNNDTLFLSQRYYLGPSAWELPWNAEYKGHYFTCYNIELSKLIGSCIPEEFMDKKVFRNDAFIMQIAGYLYNRE